MAAMVTDLPEAEEDLPEMDRDLRDSDLPATDSDLLEADRDLPPVTARGECLRSSGRPRREERLSSLV